MAYHFLRYFCLTVFFIPSLIFAANNTVKVSQGTTTYYQLKPKSIRGGITTGLPGQYSTAAGPYRVTQGFKGGIEIPAVKMKTPFFARFGWTKLTVARAVRTALKWGKRTPASFVIGTVISEILDANGWFVEDDQLVYREPSLEFADVSVGQYFMSDAGIKFNSFYGACKDNAKFRGYWGDMWTRDAIRVVNRGDKSSTMSCRYGGPRGERYGYVHWCSLRGCGNSLSQCVPPNVLKNNLCYKSGSSQVVTDTMIDGLNLDNFQPNHKDILIISDYLGEPDNITITQQPDVLVLPSKISTTTNQDGSTSAVETTTTIQPQIVNNNGDLAVNYTDTTNTTEYNDGNLTNNTTNTTVINNENSTGQTSEKIDCDLTPTLCDIQQKQLDKQTELNEFIKQPFDRDVPLPTISNRDFKTDFNVNLGAETCPQPYDMNLNFFGHISFSFEPFCEISRMIKALLLASAAIFSAYILLGVVKRG